MAEIKALKAHLGPHGRMVQAGDMIECDLQRHRALARNGIVAWPDGEAPQSVRGAAGAITNRAFEQRRERLVEPVGPTVEEWVAAGYYAKNYPPRGYASRSTQAEIEAAIAAQAAADAASTAAKVEKPAKEKSEK